MITVPVVSTKRANIQIFHRKMSRPDDFERQDLIFDSLSYIHEITHKRGVIVTGVR